MSKITLEPVPPEEAIAALRARGAKLSKTFDWRDMWQEAHATAFTVAKSTGFDILGDIYQAVDDALVKGTTFDDFKLKLTPILQKKGWWGQKLMKDPLSGRTRKVQLGSVRRLRIIFDTNLRTAYAAGTWARIQRSKKTRPYLRYVAVMDGRTRPEHQAWHDTVLPVDHEWWSKHYPPNGWNCRCTVQSLNNRDLKRYDLKVTEVPPSTKENPYTNPRNGEVVMVPQGIDPGFVYNPGAASIDGNAARLFLEKATPLPPQVTAEVMAESARVVVPALTRDFETWVDQVSQSNWKALGDIKPVGALSKPVIDYLALKKATPLSGVITLQDADLLHMVRDKKRDPLTAEAVLSLPELLAKPLAVLWEKRTGDLVYLINLPGGKRGKVIVQTGFIDKGRLLQGQRAKVITNAVRSGRLIDPADLARSGEYEVIEGELK